MENVWLESEEVYIGYECLHCGHTCSEVASGMTMQGVCVEVVSHPCANCGEDVFTKPEEE